MHTSNKEALEIFIITYNRSKYLNNTLYQVIDCSFVKYSITILDNCSNDDTYSVYLRYKDLFPRLQYKKNKINIGADANVLRAAELSNGVYTWILCDDDEYDFTNCDDVLAEINKGDVAAIMVGWSKEHAWPVGGLYGTPKSLFQRGFPYFSVPTFVPGSIFKTRLVQDQIRVSYTNIVNLLPIMTYYIGLYESDEFVYVSKSKIVVAGGIAGYYYSFFKVMVVTMNTFYMIKSSEVRKTAFKQSYPYPTYSRLIGIYAFKMWESKDVLPVYSIYKYIKLMDWKRKIVFGAAYIIAPIANKLIYFYQNFKK